MFEGLGLGDWVLEGVKVVGFEYLMLIQVEVVLFVLMGIDVVGFVEMGFGKIVVFGLFFVELCVDVLYVVGFVFSLMCEIVLQIEMFFKFFEDKGICIECFIGGVKIGLQIDCLCQFKLNIIVVILGCLFDYVECCNVYFGKLNIFVFDEVDYMFDFGFLFQV